MGRKLNKADLVARVALECDIPEGEAARAVDAAIAAIRRSLECGEAVRISGFGKFEVRVRPARPARNPRTGEMVQVPERRIVRFRPGRGLRETVNAE